MTEDNDNVSQAEAFKEQGNAFIQKSHDFKSAILAYTSAIELVNSNYIYFNNRAAAYTFAEEYQHAINDCDISLNIKENVRAYSRKAAALCELGNVDDAIETIEMGLRLTPDDKTSLNIQSGLLEMRSQAEAFKQEGNQQVQEAHDYKKAVQSYSAAIAIVKTNYIYYNNRAAAHIFAGDYQQAIDDCDTSLSIKDNVRAYSRKATALGETGDLDAAFANIEKALVLSPEDKQSKNILSGLQVMKSQAEKFKEQGKQQLKTKQDHIEAIQSFSAAISIIKSDHSYFNHRAAAYVFAGKFDMAIKDSDTSLSLKENTRAYAWKAQALGDLNRTDEALATVQRGLELDPKDVLCQEIEASLLKQKVYMEDLQEQQEEDECNDILRREGRLLRSSSSSVDDNSNSSNNSRGSMIKGIKQLGQKMKSKIVPMDASQRSAHDDENLVLRQRHARKFRFKLKGVREEKHFFYLYIQEDESIYKLLQNARKSRKERKIEFIYQKRIAEEDGYLRSRLYEAREEKERKRKARIAQEDKAVVAAQEHARDLTKWNQIMNQMAEKARLKDEKRNSAKWIKDTIKRQRHEAGLDQERAPTRVPEHLLPLADKVDLWRHQIRNKLRKDWCGMTFSIEYIEEEGLCIGFDIECAHTMVLDNLDFKIARYMNQQAISGILHKKKLHKRADKWRILEDGDDGRHMSLRFYCHTPRTNEVHLKMPRTTDIDIIERTTGFYDYDLLPRERIIKAIGQSVYLRENRPPLIKDKKDKRRPKKRGIPDGKEFVTLPSVQLNKISPGFVHMLEQDNEAWATGGSRRGKGIDKKGKLQAKKGGGGGRKM